MEMLEGMSLSPGLLWEAVLPAGLGRGLGGGLGERKEKGESREDRAQRVRESLEWLDLELGVTVEGGMAMVSGKRVGLRKRRRGSEIGGEDGETCGEVAKKIKMVV